MISPITSSQNPRYKAALRLRKGRTRRRQGRFLIDGQREILRALDAGIILCQVYISESLVNDPAGQTCLNRIEQANVPVFLLPERLFRKLAYGQKTHSLVAVAEPVTRSLSQMPSPPDALFGVIESLEKPGNVGAILRTAAAAGVHAILAVEPKTDPFNPNTVRSSLGTLFTLPFCEVRRQEAIQWLDQQQLQILIARPDAGKRYDQVDLRRPTAIVLGSEAHGVSRIWLNRDYTGVHIPMSGGVDSLNVSATAAVLFYEAYRQRQTT